MEKRKASERALVIVESPAKARTINKYLGPRYLVKASMGHVRDLPPKEFGIDVSQGFRPTYEIVRGRGKVVSELRKLAATAPVVYLATDRDREGEAIAWHLLEALDLPPEKAKRVIFNEITRGAIAEAFSNPHQIDIDRVNAQQARRILDRIVGYELSPLLWKKVAKGLSAGRVQSVAVRLIVEREREIRAFVPEESWKILAYLTTDPAVVATVRPEWEAFTRAQPSQKEIQRWLQDRGCFRAELTTLAGKPWKPDCVETAQTVAEALGLQVTEVTRQLWEEYRHLDRELISVRGQVDDGRVPRMTVVELKTKRTSIKPPAPFTTAALQQTASNALRFSATRTMRVAQALYEGIDLDGEGAVGLITYMRTDSTNLAAEAVEAARAFIQREYGEAYVPVQPNGYARRTARAQEAHEAIRPTDVNRTPASVRHALTEDQYRVYELIWNRFVSCQMRPAEWDSTTVTLECETSLGTARFVGTGRKLVFDGFMRVAGISSEDQVLPPLHPQQAVGVVHLEPRQQFTSPPARFTEASLIKALESEGIGRPSTYAAIIDTIESRGYVEQADRKFYPTALGELVTDKLVAHFPKIMDVKFTSYMEAELDQIEEAHRDWVHVLHEFYDPFRELLARAGDEMEAVRSRPSEYTCPLCAAPMVYRWSKAGQFLACTKYPGCRGTLDVDRDGRPLLAQTTEQTCELCGEPMTLRQSRKGHFLGCSAYPQCRNTVPCNEKGEPLRLVKEEELQRPCEACGAGKMTVKRKGARTFLACNRFPDCKNTAPLPSDVRLEKKPAPPPPQAGISCDQCGRPMVLRSGRRGRFIACSGFPRCRNTKPIERLEELRKAAGSIDSQSENTAGADAAEGNAPRPAAPPTSEGAVGSGEGEPPPGYAWTRTGRPVVEVLPEPGTLRCPECGGTMELKRGRFGPFFSCASFPKCRFNANLRGEAKRQAEELLPAPARPKPIPADIPCDECGSPMVLRQGRRGRFLGCSRYPKCKGTKELPAGFNVEDAEGALQASKA